VVPGDQEEDIEVEIVGEVEVTAETEDRAERELLPLAVKDKEVEEVCVSLFTGVLDTVEDIDEEKVTEKVMVGVGDVDELGKLEAEGEVDNEE